jgi:hypothetical protein
MPKDKMKGAEGKLAKAATRTPMRAIETALPAGFLGVLPGQIRLSAREQGRSNSSARERRGR